jgi:hypothetical protein
MLGRPSEGFLATAMTLPGTMVALLTLLADGSDGAMALVIGSSTGELAMVLGAGDGTGSSALPWQGSVVKAAGPRFALESLLKTGTKGYIILAQEIMDFLENHGYLEQIHCWILKFP